MSLFQFVGLLLAVLGATLCGKWGYAQFGWLGLAGGVILGLQVGWVSGIAVVALAFVPCIWLERMQQRRDMRRFFGRYWARDRASEWQALTTRLAVGDAVSGKVVTSYYYGVFMDTGHGFPALLAVLHSGTGIGGPQPVVGELVSAKVRELDDWQRFIELTQVA